MAITNLLHVSYWFAITTPPLTKIALIAILSFFILILALGVFLRVFSKTKRSNPLLAKSLKRISRPLFFCAIMGLILVWFRNLGAAILSARFWLALILIISTVWFALVFYALRKRYDAEYARLEQEKKYKEYMPKRSGK